MNEPTQTEGLTQNQLFANKQITETPFRLIGNKEQGYALSVGKYRVTEIYKTKDEAMIQIKRLNWNIIANLVSIMIAVNEEMKDKTANGLKKSM